MFDCLSVLNEVLKKKREGRYVEDKNEEGKAKNARCMTRSLTFLTLFDTQNLPMGFVVSIAFSIQISGSENPSMHPVTEDRMKMTVSRPSVPIQQCIGITHLCSIEQTREWMI